MDPREPQDPAEAMARANDEPISDWHCFQYLRESRCLLLRGWGSPHRYLALYAPTYVRVTSHFRDGRFRLLSGAERAECPVPAEFRDADEHIVHIRSQELDFYVVCTELAFFRGEGTGFAPRRCGPGAQLAGADLSGQFLGYEDLRGADLRDADLRGANLVYASLNEADLSGADLSGVVLRNAFLPGARLEQARLHEADLRGARFDRTVLQNADLSGARLSWAILNKLDLRRAVLCGANLKDARLDGCNLQKADLRGADLTRAKLEVDLRGADLRGARLGCADLSRARLKGANLAGIETDEWTRWTEDAPHPPSVLPSPEVFPTLGEMQGLLDRLCGATLKWHSYGITFSWVAFDVQLPQAAATTLAFGHTRFAEFPETLTDTRIRILDGDERDTLLEAYPKHLRVRPPLQYAYRIDSNEGTFHIFSCQAHGPHVAEPDPLTLEYLNAPLWIGGPTPVEVGTGFHRRDAVSAEREPMSQ